MSRRPYVILSGAMTMDGFIDDKRSRRLVLSNARDWKAVHNLRAKVDAILVGANTLRKDNPSLLAKKRGIASSPVKVTVSTTGRLDPWSHFFTRGASRKLVFISKKSYNLAHKKLSGVATLFPLSNAKKPLKQILEQLIKCNLRSLLVEGGCLTNNLFIKNNVVDEIRLAIAPICLGKRGSVRWCAEDLFPDVKNIKKIKTCDDMLIMEFKLTNRKRPG